MIVVLQRLIFFLVELIRAPFDALRGVNRRSYAISADVLAPKSVTWSVMSAHKIRLEGNPPIDIDASPDPARPGIYTGNISFSGRTLPFTYEILDERPGEALSLRVIKAESAPECCPGEDYLCAKSEECGHHRRAHARQLLSAVRHCRCSHAGVPHSHS
ncbi:MAG: hypothetical protein IPL91_16140 [Hyphomicrobium sp.]|nr:hypothetical protein [Hyphomicrobium sp.]